MKLLELRLSHSSLSRCLLVLAFLITFSIAASAQDLDKVTISGRVADSTGAVIPGATVIATLTTTNVSRTINTDDDGRYRLIQLEPGNYTLKISFAGFATQEKKDLIVIAGQNVQLDITMTPQGVVAEPVVVSVASAPIVDVTRTVVGATVTTHDVESLPILTRSPLDLIFTLPGVTEE